MREGIPAQQIRKGINFLYLLYFCPTNKLSAFSAEAKKYTQELERLTSSNNVSILDIYLAACSRIIEFHTNSREVDEDILSGLVGSAIHALKSEENLTMFQIEMETIRALPQRTDMKNRLHRKKGCFLCERPCRYGYFSLISDPNFSNLLTHLREESDKDLEEKNVIRAVWTFTIKHLWEVMDCNQAFIGADHLGNLSYCMLLLATAKSRFSFPEKLMLFFQESNQVSISNYQEQYRR